MTPHYTLASLNSIEYERALLGMIMLAPDVLGVCQMLGFRPEDFSRSTHQTLYTDLLEMHGNGDQIDMIAVVERIGTEAVAQKTRKDGDRNYAEARGGLAYVSALPDNVPSTENPEHYINRLIDLSARRRAGNTIAALPELLADTTRPAREIIDEVERRVGEMAGSLNGAGVGAGATEWITGNQIGQASMDRLIKRRADRNAGVPRGLSWGVEALDRQVHPLLAGVVHIIAARPGMGKTSLMLQTILAAVRDGKHIAVYSLEMTADQLADKLLALQTGIPSSTILNATWTTQQWEDLQRAMQEQKTWSIYLDTGHRTIDAIQSKTARLRSWLASRGRTLALITIDYAQLIAVEGLPRSATEEVKLAAISKGLLAMAKGNNDPVPVLALAQLNRSCESRTDKRPMKSDLRGSGQFEQDAGVILFIYRHSEYHPEDLTEHGTAELIANKVRFGQPKTVTTTWSGSLQMFGGPIDPRPTVYTADDYNPRAH
jgi:replicative DNA helicase